MKKLTIAVFAALLLAAWASAQQTGSQLLEPGVVQAAQQDMADTEARKQAEGIYTETEGALAGETWQAAYTAPDGTSGTLQSGLARAVSADAQQEADETAAGEQTAAQPMAARLFEAGVWDLIPQDSTVVLTLPCGVQTDSADTARVDVTFTPVNDETESGTAQTDAPFAAQQVTVTPGVDGALTCAFPVSFAAADGMPAHKLYCTVTVTLADGTQREFGLALASAA